MDLAPPAEERCLAMQGGTPVAVPVVDSRKREGFGLSNEDLIHQLFKWFRGVSIKCGEKTLMG